MKVVKYYEPDITEVMKKVMASTQVISDGKHSIITSPPACGRTFRMIAEAVGHSVKHKCKVLIVADQETYDSMQSKIRMVMDWYRLTKPERDRAEVFIRIEEVFVGEREVVRGLIATSSEYDLICFDLVNLGRSRLRDGVADMLNEYSCGTVICKQTNIDAHIQEKKQWTLDQKVDIPRQL